MQEGQPGAATVTTGSGSSTGNGTSAPASSQSTTGYHANGSAPLNGSAIPSVDLTFAQKAAIEMAAFQEKAASAGNWVANLFGMGTANAADTQTAGAAVQGTSGATGTASENSSNANAASGTDVDAASQEEALTVTDDFRTAEATGAGETGQDALQSQSSQAVAAGLNASVNEKEQKKSGC